MKNKLETVTAEINLGRTPFLLLTSREIPTWDNILLLAEEQMEQLRKLAEDLD